ncbi:MAG: polyphosphate polymerase domain-containing protein [Phycisphaerae bacterium]|nr:polyphosphate polymerase domain-containing protein [Phycisphaerae bacterium]
MNHKDMLESPAFGPRRSAGAPAYEVKFVVTDALAVEIENWARTFLAIDAHGDPTLGGRYLITSTYLDTPEYDVYRRTGSYRRNKFRVRTYGESATAEDRLVFAERKTKRGDRVAKRRSAVPATDLPMLGDAAVERDWTGRWFHQRVQLRRLIPAATVGYERAALAGVVDGQPLRLTLDRGLRGVRANGWGGAAHVLSREAGVPLLPGRAVLELKFLRDLPAAFKEAIYLFRLVPQSFSKYRACCDTVLGLSASGGTNAGTSLGERCA